MDLAQPAHDAADRPSRLLFLVLGLLVLFQFVSRYAPFPVTDFVADDWSSLEAGTRLSPPEIARVAWSEIDRPLCVYSIYRVFHEFGDRPELFFALNFAVNSLILVVAALIVFWLRRSLLETLLFGLLFAVVPNLTESFHWAHHTAISYMLLGYILFAACWVRFYLTNHAAWTLLAAAFYGIGLFTYESGAALPLIVLALTRTSTWKKSIAGLAPALVVVVLWALWRSDAVFAGKGHVINSRDYYSEALLPSLVAYNMKQIASWWIANNMFDCIRNGLQGLAELARNQLRSLLLLNTIIALTVAAAANLLARKRDDEPVPAMSGMRFMTFGLLWFAAGHAVSLFSWTGGRLNFIPAIGLCMVLAYLLAATTPSRQAALVAVAAFLLLPVNQGTTCDWHASGLFHRRLNEQVMKHTGDLARHEVVLFDTRQLRQRLTSGLTTPAGEQQEAWAFYGNALLLRGFAARAMVAMARAPHPGPDTVLDVECGATISGDTLDWHERWNSSAPHSASLSRVYTIDCFKAGSGHDD